MTNYKEVNPINIRVKYILLVCISKGCLNHPPDTSLFFPFNWDYFFSPRSPNITMLWKPFLSCVTFFPFLFLFFNIKKSHPLMKGWGLVYQTINISTIANTIR